MKTAGLLLAHSDHHGIGGTQENAGVIGSGRHMGVRIFDLLGAVGGVATGTMAGTLCITRARRFAREIPHALPIYIQAFYSDHRMDANAHSPLSGRRHQISPSI